MHKVGQCGPSSGGASLTYFSDTPLPMASTPCAHTLQSGKPTQLSLFGFVADSQTELTVTTLLRQDCHSFIIMFTTCSF